MDIGFFNVCFGPKFQKQVHDFCLTNSKYTSAAGRAVPGPAEPLISRLGAVCTGIRWKCW